MVRPLNSEDTKFLWVAYQRGSFGLDEGLDQSTFLVEMHKRWSYPLLWVVEDDNRGFKSGRGIVALVGIQTDGWAFMPKAEFLKWATPKNVLRSLVAFFQMMRYRKEVGVCKVEVSQADKKMMDRLSAYGVLYPRGRIPAGSKAGDTFIFSIQGGEK